VLSFPLLTGPARDDKVLPVIKAGVTGCMLKAGSDKGLIKAIEDKS
jgi:hypothetical protein